MIIRFTIFGQMVSKSNSRRLVTIPPKNGKPERPAFVKSKEALAYAESALKQIPPRARAMLTCDVKMTVRAWFSNALSDLDVTLLRDILQAQYSKPDEKTGAPKILLQRGVYVNDRQIKHEDNRHCGIDKRNPRVEVTIEPLEPHQVDLLAVPDGHAQKRAASENQRDRPEWLEAAMDDRGADAMEKVLQYIDYLNDQVDQLKHQLRAAKHAAKQEAKDA